MCNTDIRSEAKISGIYLWQIADELGIKDSNLSKMLRYELPAEEKEKIRAIIKDLSKKNK